MLLIPEHREGSRSSLTSTCGFNTRKLVVNLKTADDVKCLCLLSSQLTRIMCKGIVKESPILPQNESTYVLCAAIHDSVLCSPRARPSVSGSIPSTDIPHLHLRRRRRRLPSDATNKEDSVVMEASRHRRALLLAPMTTALR